MLTYTYVLYWFSTYFAEATVLVFKHVNVPDSKSRNIPEVVVVWRWTVGVWGFGGGGIVG